MKMRAKVSFDESRNTVRPAPDYVRTSYEPRLDPVSLRYAKLDIIILRKELGIVGPSK